MGIVFDQKSGIVHPAGNVLTVGLIAKQDALIELAKQVRQRELDLIKEGDRWMGTPCPYPFVYGAFSWFATSLTAYLQLVPVADKLRQNPAGLATIVADRDRIKSAGTALLDDVCPAVKYWRDKAGAHAAMADPRKDNSLALLFSSISYSVSAREGRFYVGIGTHAVFPAGSSEPESTHTWEKWSITETFDRLSPRFWPDYRLDDLVTPSCSGSNTRNEGPDRGEYPPS
ncbi:hypothetical protein [Stenotrophomonas sp. GZD-301]|uniref:hypothetical protein n=1 Tax=Stenotrophomonas sp. GZD-301 TaxID=3404814 RepID=UPI003BB72980